MFDDDNTNEYTKFKHFHFHDLTEEEITKLKQEAREHYEWISENSGKPYLVTLGDCEELNFIGENNGRYNDKVLNQWALRLLENIDGKPVTQKTLTQITGESVKDNNSYHASKIMYLIGQYRTVGLDSTLQAITEGEYLFVHPGMSRIHALWFLKARTEKIVVWDRHQKFSDRTALSYDDWVEVFTIEGKTTFYANVDGKIMECHMQEDRPSIAGSVDEIRAMFDRQLPVLRGKAEDDVMPYVRQGSTGVAIETKNDYILKLADLTEILGLYPDSCERIEKENFNIYKI